jgi:DNA-binding PucR family transcriptional regulator
MLKSAPGDFKKEQICSSKLLALQKYDAARHTKYYQTLSAYFQCRLNASLTAKTLHIHRSSLLTRLERMKKLFTINFDTDDDLLYLLLSWLIMEQVND